MVKFKISSLILLMGLLGCSAPASEIPGISQDHPASQFYSHANGSIVFDKACRDFKGITQIPMGEIGKGEAYVKTAELAPGVFRFYEKNTQKKYLGISYLTWSGFLLLPQLCAWEDLSETAQAPRS